MKNVRKATSSILALLAVICLAACGGGGGGGTPTATTTATSVASQGVITATGSVFVNGIEYFSNSATVIKIDDTVHPESDLKVGMVVKVRGTKDDTTKKGTATQIEARDALEGTISGVNAANNTITVMGQTVKVEDNVTRLNDDNLQKVFADANFLVNDHVEVHGFIDDQGGLRATRIVKKNADPNKEFEAKGFVVNPLATSFGLALTQGGASFMTVNFTAATPGAAAVVANAIVEVKSATAPVAGAVTATLIHAEDRLGAAGEKVEVEGIVLSGTVADFIVNGTRVTTSAATVFEGGLSTDFAVGVKLEAEGPVDANGTIAATKISFRSSIRFEGDASAVTATSLTVLGKTITTNQFTRFDTGLPVVGNHVEVRVVADRNGNLLATRVRVLSASTKAFLQGPVSAFDATAGTLSFLPVTFSITVTSDANTQWRASSTATEAAVTKAAFFAQLIANETIVKVRWDPFVSTAAAIKEAEIELGK
ncbi:MAG: hypothetical protein JJE30_16380 [Desulfuromonadales bacterium]|nr:hypothetical protein [Desulfuromonadales bacterium]